MPRDNLLNSACLELFEFIKRENIKILVQHLVDTYREKFQGITYVDTFQSLILRYDQMHEPVTTQELDNSFTSVDSDAPVRHSLSLTNGGKWSQALKEADPAGEEAYFNGSDDEDDEVPNTANSINGASPVRPLVNYPDDDGDDDEIDELAADAPSAVSRSLPRTTQVLESSNENKPSTGSPPERIPEKRRREDDEDDELLSISSTGSKRRASTNSNSSAGGMKSLRRKSPNISATKDNANGPKKISLSIPLKSGGESGGGE